MLGSSTLESTRSRHEIFNYDGESFIANSTSIRRRTAHKIDKRLMASESGWTEKSIY